MSFGKAAVKTEGESITTDRNDQDESESTTWVERCVPTHLEDEIHDMISKVLIANGYDDYGVKLS